MIETHRISNFVRHIVHSRRAVALGRASAKDADEGYVAYLDSVMVRSTAQSPIPQGAGVQTAPDHAARGRAAGASGQTEVCVRRCMFGYIFLRRGWSYRSGAHED